jgi:DNA invertase Pin-like site-specific DNA recombinase
VRLAAYTRTSTVTGAEGASHGEQEDAIRRWCEGAGHEVVLPVYEDRAISGGRSIEDRPGLAAAIVAVESGEADGLVVSNIDRLARELHVQEAALDRVWRSGGLAFEAMDGEIERDDPDDPQRTFLRQVLGAAAQLERGMISARMRRGRRRKRAAGGYAGGPTVAFGQRVEGEGRQAAVVECPDAQRAIARCRELRRTRTLAEIAEAMNAEGWPTARGGRWHVNTVRRILG